jgi:hypothetical protein
VTAALDMDPKQRAKIAREQADNARTVPMPARARVNAAGPSK